MKKIVSGVIAASLLFATPLANAEDPAVQPNTTAAAVNSPEVAILYSLDAPDTIITKSGSTFRLSLPAKAAVTWFTDRPARKVGTITLQQFYSMWKSNGFDQDPPNAALLITKKNIETTHVVEMTKSTSAKGRIIFTIKQLTDQSHAGYAHTHDLRVGNFGRSRLFIDDATTPPCGATFALTGLPQTFDEIKTFRGNIYSECLLAPGTSVNLILGSGKFDVTSINNTIAEVCRDGSSDATKIYGTYTANFTAQCGGYRLIAGATLGIYGRAPISSIEYVGECTKTNPSQIVSLPSSYTFPVRIRLTYGTDLYCT
jgi:hypothetical protein